MWVGPHANRYSNPLGMRPLGGSAEMGKYGASNKCGPIGVEEGKAAITAEKGGPAPMMSKLEAGAEDSSLAPSQFTVQVARSPNQ